jgi:hypothetical protein
MRGGIMRQWKCTVALVRRFEALTAKRAGKIKWLRPGFKLRSYVLKKR